MGKLISVVGVVVAIVVGIIEIGRWYFSPAVKLTATAEFSEYKINPELLSYINLELEDTAQIAERLAGQEAVKELEFTGDQLDFFAQVVRGQRYELKYEVDRNSKYFIVYKITNEGDISADNVALINNLAGTALIEGGEKSVQVTGKVPLIIESILPRSTAIVYFWTEEYVYFFGDKSFVKHSKGIVDIDYLVPLGGVFKHLSMFYSVYLLPLAALGILLIVPLFFSLVHSSNTPSETPASLPVKKRPRRRRRSKGNNKGLPPPNNV